MHLRLDQNNKVGNKIGQYDKNRCNGLKIGFWGIGLCKYSCYISLSWMIPTLIAQPQQNVAAQRQVNAAAILRVRVVFFRVRVISGTKLMCMTPKWFFNISPKIKYMCLRDNVTNCVRPYFSTKPTFKIPLKNSTSYLVEAGF